MDLYDTICILISIVYIHTLFTYTYQHPDVDNRQGGHTCSNIYGTAFFFKEILVEPEACRVD